MTELARRLDPVDRLKKRSGTNRVVLCRSPFRLEHGGILSELEVAYELIGPEAAPVVAVLGGISATRFVTETSGGRGGWWSDLCGPDKALDTSKFRLLSWDFLGGNGATTGPRSAEFQGQPFADVSTVDQARVLAELLGALGVSQLHALVGASYGGMVGLAFAERFPHLLAKLVVICAAHRSSTLSIAWRTIQRQMVQFGLVNGREGEGLALARALAMATYRTADEFEQRFAGERINPEDLDSFPVWNYLRARGLDYIQHMSPYAFLCLSRSIDLHRIEPQNLKTPTTVIGVRQDQLVPLNVIDELAELHSGECRLEVLDSLYGHDAFLKEPTFFSKILRSI